MARRRKKPKPAHPSPPLGPQPTIASVARIIVTGGQPVPPFLARMIVKTNQEGGRP